MRLFKSIALSLSVLFSSNTFAQKVEADQILGTYVLESIITDDIGHVLITKAKTVPTKVASYGSTTPPMPMARCVATTTTPIHNCANVATTKCIFSAT